MNQDTFGEFLGGRREGKGVPSASCKGHSYITNSVTIS